MKESALAAQDSQEMEKNYTWSDLNNYSYFIQKFR